MQPFLDLIIRSRLLSAEQVQRLWHVWQAKDGIGSDDPTQFARWLAAGQHITKYQATLLLQGMADYFFLGEYLILDRIGKGRMAGVYQARHRLGHIVAIKVLPPSKAKDPVILGRFRREARIATRLKHSHVVLTFHSGRHAEILYYIVMEYLDGETLEEVLKRRRRLAPGEAVRLLEQALAGLQHIHEKGLIHRDLKPANLMLVQPITPGEPDTTHHSKVKILDIGLGRELFDEYGGQNTGEPQLTVGEALLGDPTYMAPEQARDAHQADIRSDIYTLGCVLYETLTGQPPFTDKTPARLVLRHATDPVPPLAAFFSDAPPALQAVLDRMLAKDPAQRFQTPAEATVALKGALKEDSAPRRRTAVDAVPEDYLKWVESTQKEEDEEPPPARGATVRDVGAATLRPRKTSTKAEIAAPRKSVSRGVPPLLPASRKTATFGESGGTAAVGKTTARRTEEIPPTSRSTIREEVPVQAEEPLPEEEEAPSLVSIGIVVGVIGLAVALGAIAALLLKQYL